MRVTNKMADNYNVYNLNKNKTNLDRLNTQMSTKKKYTDPMDNPVIAARSLHFRADLSEINQYLGKNVTDAVSWTDTTQTAIDTGKDLMRSLKAEYSSAANGTNRTDDRRTYYENMVNLVNEFFAAGNATNEDRYVFTGARTADSLTFNDKNFDDRVKDIGYTGSDKHKNTYKYVGIKEKFDINDLEEYTYTARTDKTGVNGSGGVTLEEITSINVADGEETHVQNVEAHRLRLSYKDLDEIQDSVTYDYSYVKDDGTVDTGTYTTEPLELKVNDSKGHYVTSFTISPSSGLIKNDYEINQSNLTGNNIYLNTTTGNLIFGDAVHNELASYLNEGYTLSFEYNKSSWEEGDVKPEHYFDCADIGKGVTEDKTYRYADHEQSITYNVGDNQVIKVNANASDVFSIDARRDLNEVYDILNAVDAAQEKLDILREMREDEVKYASKLDDIDALINSVKKEYTYATEKLDKLLSNGITKSQDYFDKVNLAGTDMGTTVKRLRLIENRLTENQATFTAEASDNENVDISTLAVDVNSATLSYSAALQVTGKISQQSLVNFL